MNYATIKRFDIANGPGVRVSLFVSGCRHRCKNCFNPEAWDFSYGKEFDDKVIDDLINALAPEHIQGLSLLGGEPFEPENQPGILKLVKKVRETYSDKDIWCYSGFTFDELIKQNAIVTDILQLTDVLIDGKFVEELKDASLLFRGSSNQRIIDVKKSLIECKVILLDGKWSRKMGSTNIYE